MEKVKKPIYKRWWFAVIVAFFVIGLIGSLLDGEGETKKTSEVKNNNEEEVNTKKNKEPEAKEVIANKEKEEEEAPANAQEYAERWLLDELGEEAEKGVQSIESISESDGALNIALNKRIVLSANLDREIMLLNTLELAEALTEDYGYKGGIAVNWSVPLVDKYGNEEYGVVLQLEFKPETLAKMNFGNIATKNLRDVADIYGEHPAIRPKK